MGSDEEASELRKRLKEAQAEIELYVAAMKKADENLDAFARQLAEMKLALEQRTREVAELWNDAMEAAARAAEAYGDVEGTDPFCCKPLSQEIGKKIREMKRLQPGVR